MTRKIASLPLIVFACFSLIMGACAPRYEFKAIPMRPLDNYPNKTQFTDGRVGAMAFFNDAQVTKTFGFNLKKAGVIPVQVTLQNDQAQGGLTLNKATMLDADGLLWEVLPSNVVYQRINEHTSGGLSGEQGLRRTALWGLAGGILGAAVGVATGTSVGEAAGKGAAVGAALGTVSAIGQNSVGDSEEEIVRDFSSRSLDHATVDAGELANGMLYFPSEAGKPVRLNLTVTGQSGAQQLELPL
ncbi:MAG: hypothetical protein LBO05_07110 [Deltaproteobacteria bacterium]|jgi:hypothetical protein|nr:hypothetical protein [Deltaproteobacteria bacterium]